MPKNIIKCRLHHYRWLVRRFLIRSGLIKIKPKKDFSAFKREVVDDIRSNQASIIYDIEYIIESNSCIYENSLNPELIKNHLRILEMMERFDIWKTSK